MLDASRGPQCFNYTSGIIISQPACHFPAVLRPFLRVERRATMQSIAAALPASLMTAAGVVASAGRFLPPAARRDTAATATWAAAGDLAGGSAATRRLLTRIIGCWAGGRQQRNRPSRC